MKCNYSIVAVVGVFAHNQLVDQHHELHAFGAQDSFQFVVALLVIPLQILHWLGKIQLTIRCLYAAMKGTSPSWRSR